jgi:predicted lactoylglutathione lyase
MPRPIVLSLPIADRPTSFAFYSAALGLESFGEVADDGVPEPLQFEVNDGLRIMLIPTGGFGWTIGSHEVATPGVSECVLNVSAETDAEVDETMNRAAAAGATIVVPAGQQPWGYTGTFADPDGHLWGIISGPATA